MDSNLFPNTLMFGLWCQDLQMWCCLHLYRVPMDQSQCFCGISSWEATSSSWIIFDSVGKFELHFLIFIFIIANMSGTCCLSTIVSATESTAPSRSSTYRWPLMNLATLLCLGEFWNVFLMLVNGVDSKKWTIDWTHC